MSYKHHYKRRRRQRRAEAEGAPASHNDEGWQWEGYEPWKKNGWGSYSDFVEQKRAGYHRNLYRNTEEGMIGGVCAGLADYFNLDKWLVRIIAVTALIFAGSLTFVAYIAAWIMLNSPSAETRKQRKERRRARRREPEKYDDDDYAPIFETRQSRKRQLEHALSRFTKLEMRLRRMESYVTSPQYELHREINQMSRH